MKKIFQICLVGLSVVCSHIALAQSNQVLPIPAPIQAEMHGKANNSLQTAVYENIGEQKAQPLPSNFDAAPCVSCEQEIQDYQKQLEGVKKDMARYDKATQAKFTSIIAELEARIAEINAKIQTTKAPEKLEQEKEQSHKMSPSDIKEAPSITSPTTRLSAD